MKKILMILAAFALLLAPLAMAKDITLKFTWDADLSTDTTVAWERLLFFQSDTSGTYDYLNPIFVLEQSYVDGASVPTILETAVAFPDGATSTKYFIVVSQAGELSSEDSDEVAVTIDLTPLLPFTFEATYNETAKTIDFAWVASDPRVKTWQVFVSDQADGEFTQVAEVPFGESGQSVSVPQGDMFPDGALTTQHFTMVALGQYGVFSPDAPVVAITVDNRTVGNVMNFRIILTE